MKRLMIGENAKNKIEGRKSDSFSIIGNVLRLTNLTKFQSVCYEKRNTKV
jgi:hypothetical protein